ncbi:MAG: imidazole glycerol phosphate synthase subunit HisH, partial [Rhodospirillaceae bacterium]|nr:imidazole glycerol phosphate synthase subunit HisH [Rhodospirillaceae bacterium]
MIVIADYGRGNLFSIAQALRHLGLDYELSDDPARLRSAERLILPGVGSFHDAMHGLRERAMDSALVDAVSSGTPLLGIC